MLGRFTAGLLAIVVTVFMSVKYLGISEAERSENAVSFALQKFVAGMERSGFLRISDVHNLIKEISLTGIVADFGIEIGTVMYGTENKTLEVLYTDEVFEILENENEPYDLRGRLLTVYVIPKKECLGIRLANVLWESYKPSEKMVAGGYIRG